MLPQRRNDEGGKWLQYGPKQRCPDRREPFRAELSPLQVKRFNK